MAFICPNCGFDNPPGMRFCGNCGTRLPEAAAPVVPDKSPERLGVMVGSDLLERFRQAGLEARGQRRNVTVLFVDLSGYTILAQQIDSEALYEIIQKYIHLLADDVYKYEGMVDKLTGDGLMALFGAPIAHENNVERAIHSALDMLEDVRRLSQDLKSSLDARAVPYISDLNVHIGLNAGTVIAGGVGTDTLMNYTAIGDVVNLARRLEEAANPGSILVSESVFKPAGPLFDFEALAPLALKGIKRLVPAYRVIGPKVQPGSVRGLEGLRSPMIGRETELDQVIAVVQRLATHKQGHLILTFGEAGMGKSRLTSELKQRITGLPLAILEGHSLTYRKSIAYWIFQDALRNDLGITPDTPAGESRARLAERSRAVLGESAPAALPYLEQLLFGEPADRAAAERIHYLDARQLRQLTFVAVRNYLIGIARQRPLLLILEDFHWADEASIELMLFLLDSVRSTPLVIDVISRPFEGSGLNAIQERAKQRLAGFYTVIQLQALPPEQSEQLLFSLLSIPELPGNLRQQIIQRAAGLPFYLEEILRMLIDHAIIHHEGGHWRLTTGADFTSLGVPDTLQGLILTRFDRLSPLQRRVLQTATVIGQQFSVRVLQSVMHTADQASTEAALVSLADREFILPQPGAADPSYTFKHVLVSDAIYRTLLNRDRKELHGQVAQTIEALYADRIESRVELLANHYLKSFLPDRALHYLILAGHKVAGEYANTQANAYFQQALELLNEVHAAPDQLLGLHKGLGDVLVILGEYPQARQHYQTALEAVTAQPSFQGALESSILQRKIAATYERQGNYEQSLAFLDAARQGLAALPLSYPAEDAQILSDMGWNNFRLGALDKAEILLQEALKLAESVSQYDVIASIYNRLGGVYYQREQLDQASEFTLQSLRLRERFGDVAGSARTYNNLGLLYWKTGAWNRALESFNRSFKLHANLGDVEGMVDLHTNMGLLQLDRGQIDEARQHLQESLATAQQIGHMYHIGYSYLHLSLLYISIEDWNAALENSNYSLACFKSIGVKDHLVEVYTNTGLAWLGLGNLDLAQKWGQDALDLYAELVRGNSPPQSEDQGRVLRLLGRVALRKGDYPRAGELLAQSVALFASIDNQLERGRSLLALAELAAAQKKLDRSVVLFAEARQVFGKMDAFLDLKHLEKAASQT